MKDLRIVIPARDEEASIGEVIDHTKKACKDAEVICKENGVDIVAGSRFLGGGIT